MSLGGHEVIAKAAEVNLSPESIDLGFVFPAFARPGPHGSLGSHFDGPDVTSKTTKVISRDLKSLARRAKYF